MKVTLGESRATPTKLELERNANAEAKGEFGTISHMSESAVNVKRFLFIIAFDYSRQIRYERPERRIGLCWEAT